MESELIGTLINAGAPGLLLVTVIYTLKYIKEREQETRAFFSDLRKADNEVSHKLVDAIDRLAARIGQMEDKFEKHDATEMEFLRGVVVRMEKPPRRRNINSGD